MPLKTLVIREENAASFHGTVAPERASMASNIDHHALSRNHDFLSPRANRESMTRLKVGSSDGMNVEVLGSDVDLTKRPD